MKKTRLHVAAAIVAVGALGLTACSGATGGSGGGSGKDAVITVNASEPQNPLIGLTTNETGGGDVLDVITSQLVYYDKDGKVHNELAESITPNGNSTLFTVKLKKGIQFSDGTPIKAENFVKAWNYGANPKNAQISASFFEVIKGYTPAPEKEGAAAPDVPALSGLKVVDDATFTIELSQPTADFPVRLGYSAFAPLPDNAFKDMKAYGENPIPTSGPYRFAKEGAWQHKLQIDVVPNEKYTGERKPKNGGITFKIYQKEDAAYADLTAGNLDVIKQVPNSAFATYQNELGDGHWVNKPSGVFQSFTIDSTSPHFSGEEGALRRAAISMSIDRDKITKTIFQGTRTPAVNFASPVIPGGDKALANADVLKFNAAKAKELWAKADAIAKWDGKFALAYNDDAGHKDWVEAVTNSIKNTLGIDAEGKPFPDFKSLRDAVHKHELVAFRTGWQADYPSIDNYLTPLYATGASSNDGRYSNPQVDKLLKEGSAQSSTDAANAKWNEAQSIVLKDLPSIPLWNSNLTAGTSKNVKSLEWSEWKGTPLLYTVTK